MDIANGRTGCAFCFRTLDPQDTQEEYRTFVKCDRNDGNCDAVYHSVCWQITGKCHLCSEEHVRPVNVPNPPPLHIASRGCKSPVQMKYRTAIILFILIIVFVGLVSYPHIMHKVASPPILSVSDIQNQSLQPSTKIISEIGDDGILLLENAQITDTDSPTFNKGSLTVRLIANEMPGDRLSIRNQGREDRKISLNGKEVYYGNDIIGQFSGGIGVEPLVTRFNFNSTINAVQALIRSIIYSNVASPPELGMRQVEFQVTDDAEGVSNSVTRNIFVTKKNIAPKLDLPTDPIVAENTILAINGVSFEDPDSTTNITLTFAVDNGTINIVDHPSSSTNRCDILRDNPSKITLKGSANAINSILSDAEAITYKGSDDTILSVSINDGGIDVPSSSDEVLVCPPHYRDAETAESRTRISVIPSNKPPIISLNYNDVTVKENELIRFGSIAIDDQDTGYLKVLLNVKHGTIAINNDIGDTISSTNIVGNNTNTIRISGDKKVINSILSNHQSISYISDKNYNGKDILGIEVEDGGRGNKAIINISVSHVNRPPTISIPDGKNSISATPTTEPKQPAPPSNPGTLVRSYFSQKGCVVNELKVANSSLNNARVWVDVAEQAGGKFHRWRKGNIDLAEGVGGLKVVKDSADEEDDPVAFVRSYYEKDLNKRDVNSALNKWRAPDVNLIRSSVANVEWFRVIDARLTNAGPNSAEIDVLTNGKVVNAKPEDWACTVKLSRTGGEWKIERIGKIIR